MSGTNRAITELHKISQEICVKHEETKVRNVQLGVVLEQIILPALKKDELFNALFTEVYYTGSYFEGLKIDYPDEFDLILKLRLPIKDEQIQFRYERNVGGQIKIQNFYNLIRKSKNETHRKLAQWCTGNDKFDSQKMLDWFKEIVGKYLVPELERYRQFLATNHQLHYNEMKFGGFAYTFKSEEMDIDLVPAFEILRPYTKRMFKPNCGRKLCEPYLPWFLAAGYKTSNWKMCMKEYEKRLLRENVRVHVKPAIRLIKKLRETHPGWQKLTSYPIYNAAFWACKPRKPRIPASKSITLEDTFFGILEELYEGLEKNYVMNYWTNAHNDGILQTLKTKEERQEMAEEIGQVLGELRNAIRRGDAAALRELFEEEESDEVSDD